MTVKKLHKILGTLITEGHARKPVTVNKQSFTHPLESDGCVILSVYAAHLQWIPTIDDDGGYKENKDGSESGAYNIVLSGNESFE